MLAAVVLECYALAGIDSGNSVSVRFSSHVLFIQISFQHLINAMHAKHLALYQRITSNEN